MGAGIKVGLGCVVEWSSLPQSWRQEVLLFEDPAGEAGGAGPLCPTWDCPSKAQAAQDT